MWQRKKRSGGRRACSAVRLPPGPPLPPTQVPAQIESTRGELVLRGVQLQPEELAAMNQRLAAHGYEARAQEGTLLVRTQDRR